MGLFSRKRQPEAWYPVEATCGPDYRPAVLYFHPAMPAAVVAVTVSPVTDDEGVPRAEVTAEWQIRRPPRYIVADLEWQVACSDVLSLAYESLENAADDADTIVKWLLRGLSPGQIMPDLDPALAAQICNWDGQPFEGAEAV